LIDCPGRRDKAYKTRTVPAKTGRVVCLQVGQIGHGLGPRAFWSPEQLLPIMTHYKLKIWASAQRHNFTIYFETSEKANVKTLISAVTTQ